MSNVLALPVLVPMLGAALAMLAGRRPRLQRALSVAALGTVVLVAAFLVYLTETDGIQTLWVAAWPDSAGIVLVADRLSSLMLLVASLVTLAVLVFSTGQDQEEVRQETPVSIFHPTLLLLSAGVSDAFLAGDLFNLYVGFEILLFASYVLLTMGATRPRIRAGAIYVVVNLVSSALFLILLAVVYTATGTVNMAELAQRVPQLPADMQLMIQALMLTVFGIKAAVFPLSAWLPDSYPTAPAPVTAVFAGLLTKVGVYSMLRVQTLLFAERPLTTILLIVGGASMMVGILGAVAQSELKRLLSFTLVSHVGYMIMGVALATTGSLAAAIYYTAHHITIQTALFLTAGLMARVGGSTELDKVSGLASLSPRLALLFGIPALNLAGIPPFSGFIGKIGLMRAGAQVGTPLAWLLVVTSVVASLLTLYVMAKVWNRAFWGEVRVVGARRVGSARPSKPAGTTTQPASVPTGTVTVAQEGVASPSSAASTAATRPTHVAEPMPGVMVGASLGLIVVSLALTVAAGPLYEFCEHAAMMLLSDGYVTAVLGGR
ncbi:Na+/H+ antiporter subunit D [Actinomyces urogenitalis]|uniref:Na+/H+ antiporter subunit D n=2 Tax=Actinomyces urogenitalis TaxID=103621 RepID=UPI00242D8DD4|nr:Na+/H+ antiporter subunit D [Actinomyces urogenitalis]MCI7455901.1 Na+/H+ antiporter subunit D [Actinomyces urogenitalis]